jgi:CRISPR-associated protein Csb1
MSIIDFESWLTSAAGDSTAALVQRQALIPVEGPDGVFFPPTFAAAENARDFPGGYNIDNIGGDASRNVCIVDTVGSQANRIEPLFAEPGYSELVPQIVVQAGAKAVNLLEVGHRAGDAIVRCSALREELKQAFLALRLGNATPMATLAPTSLVFGVWDSRDTQAKAPRLLSSTIRAFDVIRLTRSAQYNPSIDYVLEGGLPEAETEEARKMRSERGFSHNPKSATHGGVIARGGIRRDVTLQIAALRLLRDPDPGRTRALQAYLLGLALVAFTRPATGYLRQGCNLVPDDMQSSEPLLVWVSGRRAPTPFTHEQALTFAKEAATRFGVGESRTVSFDIARAEGDLKKEEKPARKAAKSAKAP